MGPQSRGNPPETTFRKRGFLQENGVFALATWRLTTKTPYGLKLDIFAEKTAVPLFRDRLHELADYASKSGDTKNSWIQLEHKTGEMCLNRVRHSIQHH